MKLFAPIFFILVVHSSNALAEADLSNCSLAIDSAKKLSDTQDGVPPDEKAFLEASKQALSACTPTRKQWASLNASIKAAKRACDEAAAQGMSDTFRGYCNLRIADMASFIIGN